MFSRATITLGIGPQSSLCKNLKFFNCVIILILYYECSTNSHLQLHIVYRVWQGFVCDTDVLCFLALQSTASFHFL